MNQSAPAMRKFWSLFVFDPSYHLYQNNLAHYIMHAKAASFRGRMALVLDQKFYQPPHDNETYERLADMLCKRLTIEQQADLCRSTPNELRAIYVRLKLSTNL